MSRRLQQQTDEMLKKLYKAPPKIGAQCISGKKRIFLMLPITSV